MNKIFYISIIALTMNLFACGSSKIQKEYTLKIRDTEFKLSLPEKWHVDMIQSDDRPIIFYNYNIYDNSEDKLEQNMIIKFVISEPVYRDSSKKNLSLYPEFGNNNIIQYRKSYIFKTPFMVGENIDNGFIGGCVYVDKRKVLPFMFLLSKKNENSSDIDDILNSIEIIK